MKVRGPLFSLDASGTIAGTITASKWKGRNYFRETVTPSNPQTPAQTGVRSMMKWLSQNWKESFFQDNAGEWDDLAKQGNFSPFNAMVKYNLSQWRNYLPPTRTYPTTRATVPSDPSITAHSASGRNALISGTMSADGDNMGICLFMKSGSSITTNWDNLVNVLTLGASDTTFAFTQGPLTPGDWTFNVRIFSLDGLWSNEATHTTVHIS